MSFLILTKLKIKNKYWNNLILIFILFIWYTNIYIIYLIIDNLF